MKKIVTFILFVVLALGLSTVAMADNFNPGGVQIIRENDCITVDISDANNSVFEDRQPTLTIPASADFGGALLLFEGKASELEYDADKGGVSFTVAKGGTYLIVKGLEPTSSTAPSCTAEGSAVYNFRGAEYTETLPKAEHDFSDTSKETCANCTEPNPDYVAPSAPPTTTPTPTPSAPPVRPIIPSLPVEPDKPESCPGDGNCPAHKFEDVDTSLWYHDALDYVLDEGIMNGVGGDKFAPDDSTTRAMIWTMLARIEGIDTSKGSTWYELGRKWAMENGISDGTMAGNAVTREQLVTMLWRYMGEPESEHSLDGYIDAGQVSSWAEEAMRWAVENGIVQGMGKATLSPGSSATRAQVAQILFNLFSK